MSRGGARPGAGRPKKPTDNGVRRMIVRDQQDREWLMSKLEALGEPALIICLPMGDVEEALDDMAGRDD
jgi:hypothetical protein